MPEGLSLHRSVSFTDADFTATHNQHNCQISQAAVKINMSHPIKDLPSKVNLRRLHMFSRNSLKVSPPGSVTYLTCLALMAQVFAMVPFIVAYAAPYWMQASDPTGLMYSGLWRLCAYTYCENFAGHPMHNWFHTVQVCSSLALVCHIISFVLSCIYAFASGYLKYKPHFIWSAITTLIVADVFQLSSVILYGVYQGSDPGTLSWAFVLASLCTGFTVLPIIFLALEASQLIRKKPKKRPVLQRSISEASIITREVTPNQDPTKSSLETQNIPNMANKETSKTQSKIQRAGLVRMRVNSSSTLLNELNDIPCQDNTILDNSVFG